MWLSRNGSGNNKRDQEVEETKNAETKTFKELVSLLQEQKGLISSANPEILQRVRDYEQSQSAITRQINMNAARGEDLEKLALLDPLTDLYNHRSFVKELKAELNRGRRYQHAVALCLLSIDNFDDLVKQYGPLTADAILKIVGNVVKHSVREVDISGRYNGPQFIIALTRTGISGGAIVAERIRQRIGAQAISHNWQSFSLTASFGVAAYPEQATEYDQLIARALEAQEHATARGGDRVLAV